jgi:divalent metal cation (Fe/Co/Zn/Cd) transporter
MPQLTTPAPFLRRGLALEIVSLAWMVLEATVALVAGLAAHSLALTAFGLDSVIELVAGAVLLWRLLVEWRGQPAGAIARAEKIASWVVGGALLALALYILAAAVVNLIWRHPAGESRAGLLLALAAAGIMPFLAWAKIRVGGRIGSPALKADGYCSLVCAYMSWLLVLDQAVAALLPGLWWIDAAVSLLFLWFIVREGLEAIQAARGHDDACTCGHDS